MNKNFSLEDSRYPLILINRCNSSLCADKCKEVGGKYHDSVSGKYERDPTISISCYHGKIHLLSKYLYLLYS